VASHMSELSAIKAKYHEKFAEFAGKPELQTDLEQRMGEVEKRRKFLEEYYSALEKLAGNDSLVGADLKSLGQEGADVAPELVRNSSKMRQMARRRRNVWQQVA
jgi:hypothetical protein